MVAIAGYAVVGSEPLYESAQSVVYLARRTSDGRPVILKLPPEVIPTPARLSRIRREFAVTQRATGAGVIEPLELLRVDARLCLVVEDFGAQSLAIALAEGGLALLDALEVAAQLARALARVHDIGLIHKDISPANAVWNAQTRTLKLIDFGVASDLPRESPELSAPTTLEGTLTYMAPEQTGRMNRAVDWRSDLYALGATLLHLFAGRPPFETTDPMELVHAHLARRPPLVHHVNPAVPEVVSQIVAKLLAKNAEDRYQSGTAVADDLDHAARDWSEHHTSAFAIAANDRVDRFALPQRLYGRDGERQRLLDAFAAVAGGGRKLLLVAGYSGVGKSSLVNEVQRPIVQARGHFIAGKFDQLARNVPYASLIQAFRELVRQLLAEPPAVLLAYRQAIADAIAPNGQVIIDVIAEVQWIIGAQPAVPELPPAEALNRFHVVFEAFARTFATADHPLTLFLDDLQWADLPSLQLLSRFLTDTSMGHFLCVGAYRDNEVGPSHPLVLTIAELRKQGADVEGISLPPLQRGDVNQLIADACEREPAAVASLTDLAMAKTGGNPFFLSQFLLALAAEGAIAYDRALRGFVWDLHKIAAMGITDNVVDLMIHKIRALPAQTQEDLRFAAALGAQFDLGTLAVARDCAPLHAADALADALRHGLVVPVSNEYKFIDASLDAEHLRAIDNVGAVAYRFLHDRVQQAAYALVPEAERPALHLTIADRLLAALSPTEQHDRLFEILGHFEAGLALLPPHRNRELARLFAEAARRAQTSAAYAPAKAYAQRAHALVGEAVWREDYAFAYQLWVLLTQSSYLTGDFAGMEVWAAQTIANAHSLVDRAYISEIRVQAFMAQQQLVQAIDTALAMLAELGVDFPAAPTDADVGAALAETGGAIAGRTAAQLLELPEMTDPKLRAALRVMQRITSSAYVARPALFPLLPLKGVALSAQFGNTAASTYAYACYGIILAGVLFDIGAARDIGNLAVQLVDRFAAREYEARTRYIDLCFIRHWHQPMREVYPRFMPVYRAGLETGDLEFAGWAPMMAMLETFFAGWPIADLEAEAARYHDAIAPLNKPSKCYLETVHQTMRSLQGHTVAPLSLTEPTRGYDEDVALAAQQTAVDAYGVAYHLLNRLLLAVLFNDHARAVALTAQLEPWLPAMVATASVPMHALLDTVHQGRVAALGDAASKAAAIARMESHQGRLELWANHCGENYAAKWRICQAVLAGARGDGRAERQMLREGAEYAAKCGNGLEEALGFELLAHSYDEEGATETARTWFARAHQAYSLWGARSKADQLWQDATSKHLSPPPQRARPPRPCARPRPCTGRPAALWSVNRSARPGRAAPQTWTWPACSKPARPSPARWCSSDCWPR